MRIDFRQAKDKIKKKLARNKIIAGLNKKIKMQIRAKNRMINKKMINNNKKGNGT